MNDERDRLSDSCPGPLPPEDPTASRDVLARAQAGDVDAVNRLFERYYERVQRIVSIRMGVEARRFVESSDVVQETFRAALRGLADLHVSEDAGVLGWLATVAENRIRDEVARGRRAKRSAATEESLDRSRSPFSISTGATPPPDAAYRREVRELLDLAIAELPDEYREVVLLRDFCGADWPEIAAKLGRDNLNAAQQLHQRAWIRLRKSLRGKLG